VDRSASKIFPILLQRQTGQGESENADDTVGKDEISTPTLIGLLGALY